MSVSVIIVSYNTRELLKLCIRSVLDERPDEIILIDNGSTDGSAELVASDYPRVSLIVNKDNRGFGAAANQGFRRAASRFVLVLNADTTLVPGALAILVKYLETTPEAGIVGPLLLNRDDTAQHSCRRFPGTLAWLLDNRITGKLFTHVPVLRSKLLSTWDLDEPRSVPCVIGAAFAARREEILAAGGFDEQYFLYCEDLDLCRRFREMRREVHFLPAARVYHVGGASTCQQTIVTAEYLVQSMLRFYATWYSAVPRFALVSLLKARLLFRSAREATRAIRITGATDREQARSHMRIWWRLVNSRLKT